MVLSSLMKTEEQRRLDNATAQRSFRVRQTTQIEELKKENEQLKALIRMYDTMMGELLTDQQIEEVKSKHMTGLEQAYHLAICTIKESSRGTLPNLASPSVSALGKSSCVQSGVSSPSATTTRCTTSGKMQLRNPRR